jgi:lipopolysaccharide export system permease protein
MDRVSRYLLSNFFQTFMSLFFTLFFLASVIFFIKISHLTSLFSITFSDLGEAYLYLLPEIIVYTLPITFFIAVAMTIFKMSKENETIVLFALTLSPHKIARVFFMLSLGASLFLLVNSVLFIPIAKQLNKNFIEYKKLESKINIKATEFGQKFEDWNLFINDVSEDTYKDIVLYSKNAAKEEERFIIAKSAHIEKNGSIIGIVLREGKLFNIQKERLDEINYDGMTMSYKPNVKELHSDGVIAYWMKALSNKTRAKDLSINILISFFPLATFLFAISFGVANTRHEKPNIYLYIFIVVLIYYLLMFKIATTIPLIGTGLLIIGFHIASGIFFREKILKRY